MHKSIGEPQLGLGKGVEVIRELFPEHRKVPVRHQYPKFSIVDDGHLKGLGNPNILRAIFSHLPLRDLIQLRRVNLRWNFIACEYLREKLRPCRVLPSRMKTFIKIMKHSCCNPFSSYAIRVENTGDSVFLQFMTDFKMDIVSLRMKFAGNEMPALLGLLHQLPNLTNLHVIRLPEETSYLSRSHNSDEFWRYKYQQLVNLKSLVLEKENLGLPFIKDCDTYIVNIINSAPNLTEVKFVNWGTPLSHIFQSCEITNPKAFNGWNPNILKYDMMQLFECGLQFKSVKLIFDDENNIVLTQWIKGQSSSLKCLSIKYYNDKKPNVFPNFCCQDSILTLYLHRWKGPVDFSSLKTTFSELNTLSLNSDTLEDLSNNNANQVNACLTLKVLILMPLESCINDAALKRLAIYFPNVSQLFVQLSGNDSAHVIYKEWPKLQVLFLDFKEGTTDEAITGIPNDCFEVKSMLACGCVHINYIKEELRETSIADLKDLLILVIRCGEGLTSLSAIKGICALTQLQRLWLLPNPDEEFYYTWCLKAIADGLKNLEHLVIAKEVEFPKENLEYLMDRLPFIHLQYK